MPLNPFFPLALVLTLSTLIIAQTPERVVDVPDINGMAVTLVKPAFPETAVAANADGEAVTLKVVVDEHGTVVSATCSLSCHPMLRDAAEAAALQSKFKPLIREGRAIRYQGILLYSFVVKRVDWFRFATALESTRQFDNISLGPVAQILSSEFAKEKASLLALDEKGIDFDRRQKTITEVERSLKGKLSGTDLWRFDLGMALRRITFWTMAGGPADRTVLQKSIEDLVAVIKSAPDGTSELLINELTAISKYRIPAEISERELRMAISDMSRKLGPHLR